MEDSKQDPTTEGVTCMSSTSVVELNILFQDLKYLLLQLIIMRLYHVLIRVLCLILNSAHLHGKSKIVTIFWSTLEKF